MAFTKTLKCRAPDKWFSLFKSAHEDVFQAAAATATGKLSLASVRKLAAQRTQEWLAVQPSNKIGGGLGVFTKVDIPEGGVITEFSGHCHLSRDGDEAHAPLQDYEKRLRCVELHGNGWAEGLNKIYSCTPKVSHSPGNFADDPAGWRCTIFGANHSISNDSGAEESSAGVAQIINDHVCVTFADLLPDGASSEKDLDVAMARCLDACLHPSRVGSGSSVSSILGDLDFRRFCAASDNYLAAFENRAHSVAMVPMGSAEAGRNGIGVFAVAARDIAAGEELLYSYGLKWWLGRARLDVRNSLARCLVQAGAANQCLPDALPMSPPLEHPLRRLLESFYELSASRLDVEREAAGATGVIERSGVGPLEPITGRALDNFIFQRTCLETLKLSGLNPKQQYEMLLANAESDPAYRDALTPPWSK